MLLLLLIALGCFRNVPDSAQESPALDSTDTQAVEMVQVSGNVFRFADRVLLEGARVELAGADVSVLSDQRGEWSAQVPAGVDFVPQLVELADYLPAHHATFNLSQDEDRMYLQAVPVQVFGLMAAALAESGVSLGTEGCILVNTVTMPEVDEMDSWQEFLDLRPHGEPGVVMELLPKTHGAEPIYFNEQIQPDPSLSATTRDGGVLWLNIAPGSYTLRGTHPDPEFEVIERRVECQDSEFINLNPPLGAGVRRRR